ncbi:MAG: peptidase M14, partial [Calditrichaeota bacterium]
MKRWHLILALFLVLRPGLFLAVDWQTPVEKSNFQTTPRYQETMDFCRRLEAASSLVHVTSFGTSPQGRPLPLVVVDADGLFSPELAHRQGRTIVLIMSGIHAGEIDGKDASLMFLRDMAIEGKWRSLLEDVTLLFIPIFNVDGHERFGPYNRMNQNGPREMGWRTTAQNLNLNRDWLKADAPEMQAWLAMFNRWLPDLMVDIHVT